jgi:uncharacterized protein YndB with AHSA1/START domain
MTPLTVETYIQAPIEKIWQYWTEPTYIQQWCHASDDWHVPRATNDLTVGGKFLTTMAAKDGSTSFDFTGTYTAVELHKKIAYTIDGDDHRKVVVEFIPHEQGYRVVETFDPETINAPDRQKAGWQAILESFKKTVLG